LKICFFADKESDPSYLSVCQLFEEYFKRMKDLYDYVSLISIENLDELIDLDSLILNKNNHLLLIMMKYWMMQVKKNEIVY